MNYATKDMTILREALPIALDFAKDLVPADFAFIVEYDGLTKADLIADVKSVVEVLQEVVNLGAVDLYLTKDMNIENLTPLKNIIERLFNLNLLSGKFDDLAITVLSLLISMKISSILLELIGKMKNNYY